MKVLIGVSGKMQHGKDAFAFALTQLFGFRRAAFADSLKAACGEIFGFSTEQMYGAEKETPDPYWNLTPRDVMQRFGTEAMRSTFGADIWVRSLMRTIEAQPLAFWVVPDVRFPNEAEAIKAAGGIVVRIERPTGAAASTHISELALDSWQGFDALIKNDGSLQDLEDKAAQLFLWLLDRQAANDDTETPPAVLSL